MTNDAPNEQTYPTGRAHSKYRRDIDGLRALAVLGVVGFHAFPEWVKGGFIGVDVFFVISGFLISTIIFESLESDNFSFIEFYSRRIKRIFPALLIVLITLSALGWYFLFADEYKQLGKHIMASSGFVSNFVLWNESGYFDKAAETKLLLHMWSLGIEEQFYIIWPLLLWSAWKKRINLLIITVFFALASFALNLNEINKNVVAVFYSPQTRFWELLIGSVIAYMTLYKSNLLQTTYKFILRANIQPHHKKSLGSLMSISGGLLLLTGICIITKEIVFPDWWAILPTLGAGMIISAGSTAWLNHKILSSRLLVWFGLISFPLYLWHWPLLSLIHIVENEPLSLSCRMSIVIISIGLAWLTYLLVEKPIRNHSKGNVAVLVALMVTVGYGGYHIYKRDGLPLRWDENIQVLGKFDNAFNEEFQLGTCFLKKWEDPGFDNCRSTVPSKKSGSIFLWGDSHAAHLYPGLNKVYGANNSLTHFSLAGCPPIIEPGYTYLACSNANTYILKKIAEEMPDRIIIAADWVTYNYDLITSTIDELKRIGIKKIDLIGPVPHWNSELPKLLSRYLRAKRFPDMPNRLSSYLATSFKEVDSDMRILAKNMGVGYISAVDIFCNSNGCLTKSGASFESLMTWDSAHLTVAGSEYLVSHFPEIAKK